MKNNEEDRRTLKGYIKNTRRYSEVVDSIKSAKDFLKTNKIKQNDIVNIIIVWDE